MCPACIASAAVMAANVTSGGGLVTFVVARFRRIKGFYKPRQERKAPQGKAKEKQS